MRSDPDYVVIDAPGEVIHGVWYDRSAFGKPLTVKHEYEPVIFEATGEFVFRNDGAVAEVWRPLRSRPNGSSA